MRPIFYTLKSILFFVRTHIVGIVVGFAIIGVIIGVIARILFPELFAPKYDVQFSGDSKNTIQSAPIYSLQNQIAEKDLPAYFGAKLNLPQKIDDAVYNEQTQSSLSPTGEQYSDYSDPTKSPTGPAPTVENGEEVAREFLLNLGYPNMLQRTDVQYFAIAGSDLAASTPDKATILDYHFALTLNNLPVIAGTSTPSIEVFVTNQGVVKAHLPPLIFTLQPQASTDLVSVSQALNDIAVGKFSSSQVTADGQRQGSFKLESKSLVYLTDPDTQQLIPTYQFKGSFTSANGQTQPVEVFVRAIQ